MPPSIDLKRAGAALLAAWIVAIVVFRGWPGVDLKVSGLFWDAAGGFDWLQSPVWEWLRNAAWNIEIVLFVFSLGALIVARSRRHPVWGMGPRVTGWVCALFLLGPGLVVNGIFKSFAGRARPANIEEFGGAALFTPAGVFTDQCRRNCSFPSGEVNSAVTMALALWVLSAAMTGLPDWARRAMRVFGVATAVFIAIQRVVDGRHFLSDAVFATLIALTLAWALWPLFSGVFPCRRKA